MALLRGVGTPPGKGAGLFWNTAHIRRLSGDGVQAVAPGQVQPGYCPDQADGVGVLRIFKHLVGGAVLHDLAAVHDLHRVRVPGHDAQIVGDDDQRRAEALPQLVQLLQHLGLDGDVQGGGGLVADEDVGVAAHAHGDHGPLLHPAGKFMGILFDPLFRIGNIHPAQQLHRLLKRLFFLHPLVDAQGFGDLVPNGHHRVQGGGCLLKDHTDLTAPNLSHLLV